MNYPAAGGKSAQSPRFYRRYLHILLIVFTPAGGQICFRRLREKIEKDPGKPDFVKTVWGIGYKFETESGLI